MNPAVDRYLTNLSRELDDMPEPERTEVIQEIRNHAAEAMRAGEDAATIIQRLGAPEQLAQAYRIELEMTRSRRRGRRIGRVFAILGVTAISSLASFVVVVVLGALTLGFIGGGVAAIVGGAASLLLPGDLIVSTLPMPQTINELLAIGLGVILSLAGFLAAVMLFLYVRTVVRGFRRITGRLRESRV